MAPFELGPANPFNQGGAPASGWPQQQAQGFGSLSVPYFGQAWQSFKAPTAHNSPGPNNAATSAEESPTAFPDPAPHSPAFSAYPSSTSDRSISPPIGYPHRAGDALPSSPYPASPIGAAAPPSPSASPDRSLDRIQVPEHPWAEPKLQEGGVAARQLMLQQHLQAASRQHLPAAPAARSCLGRIEEEEEEEEAAAAEAGATAVAVALATLADWPQHRPGNPAAGDKLELLPARCAEQLQQLQQDEAEEEQVSALTFHQPATPRAPSGPQVAPAPVPATAFAASGLPSAAVAAAAATAALHPAKASRKAGVIDEATTIAAAAAATAALLASERGLARRSPHTLGMFWPRQAAPEEQPQQRRPAGCGSGNAAASSQGGCHQAPCRSGSGCPCLQQGSAHGMT
jgi:hypothetical protein